MRSLAFRTLFGVLGAAALFSGVAYAQDSNDGKLKIKVSPDEAYIFVDGQAIGPGNRSVQLPTGPHKLLVANYGHRFSEREVTINPIQKTPLHVVLERQGDLVSGPKGRIQIEEANSDQNGAAVLLNGKTPAYFVGHVDEFNHDIIWHQELIVPPGKHLITVTRRGQEMWSGTVTVPENQRVIVYLKDGRIRTTDWPRGKKLGSLRRFKAGTASATVAVAPVSSSISANPAKVDCGQASELKWTSAETLDADISGMSPVPLNGQSSVVPKQTTTYELTATGPGGVTKSGATVEVNPVVLSSLTASSTEVRYRRIGDKVKEITKVAAVHIIGSIEPIPVVLLHSVFYPTDYPTKHKPSLGLVRSQQQALVPPANGFTKYLEYDPEAKLSLAGYADERNTKEYNQALSERRVQRVKDYLVSQGIPENKIETAAYGEEKPLDKATVVDLQAKNPNQPPEARAHKFRATWLAYNRRVDVVLLPTNRESLRFYPNTAPDSEILWQRARPDEAVIEKNQ